MSDKILWRKIMPMDMASILGQAAPAGGGGGSRHIVLGADRDWFLIHDFLDVTRCEDTEVVFQPIHGIVEPKIIGFSCLASRRGGEWIISRQHNERYPLWTEEHGFPRDVDSYDPNDPPVILIIRISNEYHARFYMLSKLDEIAPDLQEIIANSAKNSGIQTYRSEWGVLLRESIPPPQEEARIIQPSIPASGGATAAQTLVPTPPSRPATTSSTVTRYIRDSKNGRELKKLYDYKCIFCEIGVQRPHDTPYVEACHIKPLNEGGPDEKGNLLILCPNHHVEFDYGTVTINPSDMKLQHIDTANSLHDFEIQLMHDVNSVFLQFHFDQWMQRKLMGY